ncbi:rod shape-determining protein MreC [Alteromonas sp. a30]|uniref:rod shape-determining protein MreC n=1 Tax=Alteromonas sp. a30 TaxID=2730917 RepID=UPI00228280B0|nr:rod shape-determining protein MreC [Alteromonas sp. a30]MCY7295260.1 rod shape-determining protein MreC [Alteromonas sp. a30]
MDNIFSRGPSLNSRLVMGIILSLALMVMDHRLDSFRFARVYLNSLVAPLQYVANIPSDALNWLARELTSKRQLLEENARLTHQATLMSEENLRYQFLKRENDRLRTLLGSPVRENARKMVAELMAVDNNPYSKQIVIDKGAIHGVYQGQAVLDEHGIVGQVLQVATTNSRILLISDITHATPTRLARNDVRLIASGSGDLDELVIDHVAHSTDIKAGDILISSGLGNVFPEGYPVAKVTSVIRDESRPFASIKAEPAARLDRLKYLLLLWPSDAPTDPASPTFGDDADGESPSKTQEPVS